SSNPVAAPYFNFTIPEPTGVVGVVAPETSSLLGLVSRLAPPLVSGNAVVLLASESRPLPAISLSEVLAASDVPGGVVNVLTGRRAELVPVLAAHVGVDALDTWGVPDALRLETEQLAADDVKRLSRRPSTVNEARFDWLDDRAAERPEWIAAFLEMKTVWHPIGV
ncbi:MAG TPA: aldehyde dehydrogenase family protein, partial [Candidatus Limnocylindrales bacterium]|nr:aldehyde dehydrogenase family protein [Candidatus Limnocylindrales bacterium]